jgi:hypothetical protein
MADFDKELKELPCVTSIYAEASISANTGGAPQSTLVMHILGAIRNRLVNNLIVSTNYP